MTVSRSSITSSSGRWTLLCMAALAFGRSDACGHAEDPVACLKMKAIATLDRASRADSIPLADSLSLVRRDGDRTDRAGRAVTETELEAAVPAAGDPNTRHDKLNRMLFDTVARLLNGYVLRIGLPSMTPEQLRTSIEEGRGKMKKTMGMMMTAAAMKAMMIIPLALGVLFLMAGKAMIISKIALVLSLIIALKKLMSKSSEHMVHEAHPTSGWASGGSAGGGWDKRSASVANQMAYSSYKP